MKTSMGGTDDPAVSVRARRLASRARVISRIRSGLAPRLAFATDVCSGGVLSLISQSRGQRPPANGLSRPRSVDVERYVPYSLRLTSFSPELWCRRKKTDKVPAQPSWCFKKRAHAPQARRAPAALGCL